MDAQLHNVAIYVGRDEFDDVRAFYAERLGLPIVFEEPGHICCFSVGIASAICVHEAEPGHPAGTRELFLWVDDEAIDPLAEERLNDPVGNQIRLHRRR
jgi:catechol 2,3-dioxygenase-like lactoylglutathione lyase family enzyme